MNPKELQPTVGADDPWCYTLTYDRKPTHISLLCG